VYEAAAKLQPNDAPTHNNVGRIYLKRKRLDEAIAQFREALKIDPISSTRTTTWAWR
jgi:Tfp pilus assembly protein PilF